MAAPEHVPQDPADLLTPLIRGLEVMAHRRLLDPDDAHDAVQETLARAVEALRLDRVPAGAPLAAFVHGIARHVIADVHRRRGRRAEVDLALLPTIAPSALEQVIGREDLERLGRALDALPRADRDLLHRCYVGGERLSEIAGRSGEPAERIRKRKSRALERIRAVLAAAIGNRHVSPPKPMLGS